MPLDVEVFPVGGYSDFGRNMTCVRVGDEAVIFDMGIKLDRVLIHEDAVFEDLDPETLQEMGAIPDDSILEDVDAEVQAIVFGHGHLDHIGAVSKLAPRYPDAPIYGTPYTMKLVEDDVTDERTHGPEGVPNPLRTLRAGETEHLTGNLELEFVNVTHSIVQTVLPVLHTPRGAIVYANDYKFDNFPVVGDTPDYERLRELGVEDVLGLIVESTNSKKETKTPSETIARDLLRDYLFGLENERSGLLVSTFSSHTARLKSIIEFGDELDREIILLGRSLEKYNKLAHEVGMLDLPTDVKVAGYRAACNKALKQVMEEGKENFLMVATGHQGEPNALLSRIADRETPYRLDDSDQVIFSADVIPNPVNRANRHTLETKLNMQDARIIKGAHVSGHASREDHRELLNMLEPDHIFPAHGGIDLQSGWVTLGERYGYSTEDDLHLLRNGQPKEI
jgi:ribonuclease J